MKTEIVFILFLTLNHSFGIKFSYIVIIFCNIYHCKIHYGRTHLICYNKSDFSKTIFSFKLKIFHCMLPTHIRLQKNKRKKKTNYKLN